MSLITGSNNNRRKKGPEVLLVKVVGGEVSSDAGGGDFDDTNIVEALENIKECLNDGLNVTVTNEEPLKVEVINENPIEVVMSKEAWTIGELLCCNAVTDQDTTIAPGAASIKISHKQLDTLADTADIIIKDATGKEVARACFGDPPLCLDMKVYPEECRIDYLPTYTVEANGNNMMVIACWPSTKVPALPFGVVGGSTTEK